VTEGLVYDLTASEQNGFSSLAAWLKLVDEHGLQHSIQQTAEVVGRLDAIGGWDELHHEPDRNVRYILGPLDLQEVWGAGVTYYRRREAREDESSHLGIYDRVYDAQRPEIFFKATPHRVVGPYDLIRARSDSDWSVPEPELTVVLSPGLEAVGYTVGNDVSSRDIEGENPLYLAQAKIFWGSCALGPVITPAG
jgi:2-dehydro-3-deoxy-D-arabinonate dehydratase